MNRNHAGLGLLVLAILLTAQPAAAYIGPGAGITMLGALWGVLLAILLALAAVLFWPIRALMRRRRKAAQVNQHATQATGGQVTGGEESRT